LTNVNPITNNRFLDTPPSRAVDGDAAHNHWVPIRIGDPSPRNTIQSAGKHRRQHFVLRVDPACNQPVGDEQAERTGGSGCRGMPRAEHAYGK
jgi:hypothetical protein